MNITEHDGTFIVMMNRDEAILLQALAGNVAGDTRNPMRIFCHEVYLRLEKIGNKCEDEELGAVYTDRADLPSLLFDKWARVHEVGDIEPEVKKRWTPVGRRLQETAKKEGRDAIHSALAELIEHGCVEVE